MSKMFNGLLVQFDEQCEPRSGTEGRGQTYKEKMHHNAKDQRYFQQKQRKQNKLFTLLHTYLTGSFVEKFGFKK